MRDGINGGPLDESLKYAKEINSAGVAFNVSPLVLYALACNESILGEYGGKWNAATVESADGGHGLFQLTSSWPSDWEDPQINADYAAENFVVPAWTYWARRDLTSSDLVRAIAASFNAGIGGAQQGHDEGDVDKFTTDHYAARALSIYEQLAAGTFRPSEAESDQAPTGLRAKLSAYMRTPAPGS